MYKTTLSGQVWRFDSLKTLLAKASPARSGDALAGIIADSAEERMAAKMALAEVPLKAILDSPLIPYEQDEVTRLIIDTHDSRGFAAISHLTVGDFRDWLLDDATDTATLQQVARAITPEMAAAVSKLMRNQDLILAASKCRVTTRFRNTIGLPGHLSVRLQPNHPTDDLKGIAASMLDGLLYGAGDAVIGINPASDSLPVLAQLNHMLDDIIQRFAIPTQSCILTHVTNTLQLIERGAPVDLVFQSVAGTEAANGGFGINLALLQEAREAALSLNRGTLGNNVMYFETGQGAVFRLTPTTASISKPAKPAPTPSPAISIRCWSIPWWDSSARNISMTGSRLFAPASRITSAARSWGCRLAATFAIPTTPRRIRMIWTPC